MVVCNYPYCQDTGCHTVCGHSVPATSLDIWPFCASSSTGPQDAPGGTTTGTTAPSTACSRTVTDAVIEDLESRTMLGMMKYGRPLTTHNGRSALRDLYEELLDACQYLKQQLMEMGDE